MASTKGKIIRWLGGAMLKRATIDRVDAFGRFRRLGMSGALPGLRAGAKVQVLLPSDDVRTYTPIPTADGWDLLGFVHGGGPGSDWLAHASPKTSFSFVGPQRSLDVDDGSVVLVGDETSVAVAAALASERPGRVRAVIVSAVVEDVVAAAAAVGLVDVVVVSDVDAAAAAVAGTARVVVTGGAPLVVATRTAVKHAGGSVQTKTYWIPGRSGLD